MSIIQKILRNSLFVCYCMFLLSAKSTLFAQTANKSVVQNKDSFVNVDNCECLPVFAEGIDVRSQVVNGDSVAFGKYVLFQVQRKGVPMYYSILQACKYGNQEAAEFAVAYIKGFYPDCASGVSLCMDSLSLRNILFLSMRFSERKWAQCELKNYYCYVAPDSTKARRAAEECYSDFLNNRDTAAATNKHADYPSFKHTYEGSMESIQKDGNIQAYEWLIEHSRKDENNPNAFYECMYYAMLMANRYNYGPAFEHMCEILRSFYPGADEDEVDESTRFLMNIYGNYEEK